MNKGHFIPVEKNKALESPENAQNRHSQTPSVTFYVYVELLEAGKNGKPVKVVKKLKKCIGRYGANGNEAETNGRAERARIKALESAVEAACEYLYRLRDEKVPFARVFISGFENVEAARKDPDSFDYSFVSLKRKKGTACYLSDALMRNATVVKY